MEKKDVVQFQRYDWDPGLEPAAQSARLPAHLSCLLVCLINPALRLKQARAAWPGLQNLLGLPAAVRLKTDRVFRKLVHPIADPFDDLSLVGAFQQLAC